MKINKISPQEQNYLQIIQPIANKPKALYYVGTLPEERIPTVAIIGSRKPTAYGREVTYKIAYELAQKGIIIISGLALGVDGIAHRAALDAGGITLAILANGLHAIYPASHRQLGQDIIRQGGAIISEYEPGVGARKYQFLERNRLVSGLSDVVIITEAASRSGTLNTTAHALDQGKDVFAVPGNITSPLSSGCNALIKQGAFPLTDAMDVLSVVAPSAAPKQTQLPLGTTPLESSIIELLSKGIRDGEELHQQIKVEVAEFNHTLTMLELSGTVRALGGNQWTLA